MALQAPDGVLSDQGTLAQLAVAISSSGFLHGTKIRLYQSNFGPNNRNVWADYSANEANFPGYSAQALTWNPVTIGADGTPVSLSDQGVFICSASTSPNQIGGAVMTQDLGGGDASASVVGFYGFPNPITMATAFAFVGIVVAAQQPDGGGYATVTS